MTYQWSVDKARLVCFVPFSLAFCHLIIIMCIYAALDSFSSRVFMLPFSCVCVLSFVSWRQHKRELEKEREREELEEMEKARVTYTLYITIIYNIYIYIRKNGYIYNIYYIRTNG